MEEIFIFPDTNVFEHCIDVHEIPWQDVVGDKSAFLAVARIVQQEIDKHKRDANPRRAKRARKATALFKAALLSPNERYVVQESKPRVVLTFPERGVRRDEFPVELDPDSSDDRLVAEALSFKTRGRVIVLTHDTGLMLTSKRAGLELFQVPDGWLLPPEPDARDARIRSLEQRVQSLEKVSPRLVLGLADCNGAALDGIEVQPTTYPELAPEQIGQYVEVLKKRYPMREFGNSPDTAHHIQMSAMQSVTRDVLGPQYIDPTESEIREYVDQKYPAFVEKLKAFLRELPTNLNVEQRQSPLILRLCNEGGCPAEDVLVEIECSDGLFLMTELFEFRLDLPQPPKPPERLVSSMLFSGLDGSAESLPRIRRFPSLAEQLAPPDPYILRWRKTPDKSERSKGQLICGKLRHQSGPQAKTFAIGIPFDVREGVFTVAVTAANVAKREIKNFPIRVRERAGNIEDVLSERFRLSLSHD